MSVVAGPEADILVGNALPLKNIPLGTTVHNIELRPGRARRWRAAPAPRASRRERRRIRSREASFRRSAIGECELHATIGQVGISIMKTSRSERRDDAPHGNSSDESRCRDESGRSSARRRRRPREGISPDDPWGKPTLGYKTRNNKRTDKFIVKRKTK
jgi:large subunit ribosomal protein L2